MNQSQARQTKRTEHCELEIYTNNFCGFSPIQPRYWGATRTLVRNQLVVGGDEAPCDVGSISRERRDEWERKRGPLQNNKAQRNTMRVKARLGEAQGHGHLTGNE